MEGELEKWVKTATRSDIQDNFKIVTTITEYYMIKSKFYLNGEEIGLAAIQINDYTNQIEQMNFFPLEYNEELKYNGIGTLAFTLYLKTLFSLGAKKNYEICFGFNKVSSDLFKLLERAGVETEELETKSFSIEIGKLYEKFKSRSEKMGYNIMKITKNDIIKEERTKETIESEKITTYTT